MCSESTRHNLNNSQINLLVTEDCSMQRFTFARAQWECKGWFDWGIEGLMSWFCVMIFIICCSFCSLQGSRTVFVPVLIWSVCLLCRLFCDCWCCCCVECSVFVHLSPHTLTEGVSLSSCDGAASESVLKLRLLDGRLLDLFHDYRRFLSHLLPVQIWAVLIHTCLIFVILRYM